MAVYTVDTTSDVVDPADHMLSLREALALADADPATADRIDFASPVQGGRIVLAGSQLTVNSDVTIDGGVGVTVDAKQTSRVLLVQGGTEEQPNDVALANLTVTGGHTNESNYQGSGGGILNAGAYSTLALDHATVSGNSTAGDSAYGGGISGDHLTLTNCTISGNSTAGDGAEGGGVRGSYGTLTNCTISDNSTSGGGVVGRFHNYFADGGGISGIYLTLTNCTVSGNSATGDGAAGGGVDGRVLVANSIIAGNAAASGTGSDVAGNIESNGLNIFGSDVDGNAPGDRENVSVGVLFAGGLAPNGGPTETIALLDDPSNPALGRADPAFAPTTDQRGVARPAPEGTHPDIGSFELDQSNPIPPPVAQTFTVTTTSDVSAADGVLTLREALALADADSSTADRIEFAAAVQGQTIHLVGGQLTANSDVTIDGGIGVTIDAEEKSRVFAIQGLGANLALIHLTITGGKAADGFGNGGGIYAGDNTLSLLTIQRLAAIARTSSVAEFLGVRSHC